MLSFINNISIKNKLILPIIIFIAVTFVTIQSVNYTVTFEREKESLIQRVKVLAQGVAYNLQAAILFEDKSSAQEILSAFVADKDIVRVKLYDINEQLFASYQVNNTLVPRPNADELDDIADHQFAISEHFIFLLVPVTLDDAVIANLRVTISKETFNSILTNIFKVAAVYLLFLVILGGVLVKLVQRLIIEPMFDLNDAMQAFIERRSEQPKLVVTNRDEIGELVRAFNTMLERLQHRDNQINFTLDKLQEEKSFANEVIETVQHSLLVVDEKGVIVHANAATRDIFKCSEAFLEHLLIQELIVTKQVGLLQDVINANIELNDELLETTDLFQSKRWLRVSSRSLSKHGRILYAIQDVTNIETAMSRQRIAAGVFENSKDGLIVLNSSNVITMVNPAVTELLGYHADLLVGKTPFEVFSWQQFSSLMPTIRSSLENYGQWQGEVWEKSASGTLVPMFVKVNRVASDNEKDEFDMVLTLSDLSNVKEMERLEHLAHHDALTGLANRAQLYKVMDDVVTSSHYSNQHFTVIYLDLDGFKEVNDNYGHDAGDEILKEVSNRLLSQVRAGDLVARLSGDEFVLIIKQTNKILLAKLAERLLELIGQEVNYKQRSLHVGASLGIHLVDGLERDIDVILKVADEAMYQAKRKGKGQFVFSRDS
ncbi:PAS domain S-box-containing protein/diguanylate cyclase (GGDEF)-like protein [Vibrio crassostreae]|uniref:diguanylate cyclase domain-containing protein n=1 Tax=Vibrio crassostreae TaxID=246167 RepID=UPI000F47EE77|nr:diguanylate cyclase [Vibrio crassostreae]ROR19920.1 PAS domain S-box-containing protein/diguanylate cyclase (GGDEF)-like protein [Vibrio crassostreae]CAK2156467.1 PAS domain S-box-containing protein/diguanylate cyclase (GGDEF)-like protein [Vibrio crassostreae]CAK2361960.1 PAS domain S-box-containing protein/diguanylate cyclase (GGDEF)-like protein [Vibrio crassostreae]CAK2376067.1 PAS domain S-box-containing protein/diguanylate cyclase (GGDEF)-like protein [Vibrio crassostreae]CAK3481521.1